MNPHLPENLVFKEKSYKLETFFCAKRLGWQDLYRLGSYQENELMNSCKKEIALSLRARLIQDGETKEVYSTGCKIFKRPANSLESLKEDLKNLVTRNGLGKTWLVDLLKPKYHEEHFWYRTSINNKYYTLAIAPPSSNTYRVISLQENK